MDKEEFLKQFREATKGLSKEEVCKLLYISKGTYIRWEAGNSAPHKLGRKQVMESIAGLAGS